MNKILPKKNHKIFLSEMCALMKDYYNIKDLRDKEELNKMLLERIPKIINNFDKSDPSYEAVQTVLFETFENIGLIIKFVKQ